MHDQDNAFFRIRICFLSAWLLILSGCEAAVLPEAGRSFKTRGPTSTLISDPKPLSFKINYVYREGGAGELKSIEDGTILHTGDYYKIQFTPEDDGYVYIFQVDTSNNVFQLFPMEQWGDMVLNNRNPVRSGITYSLPSENQSFVLDEHRGKETIYFVGTRTEDPKIAKLAEQLKEARKQGDNQNDLRIQDDLQQALKTRGLARIVADPASQTEVTWTNEESFKLPAQRLDELCDKCTNVITFEHQ